MNWIKQRFLGSRTTDDDENDDFLNDNDIPWAWVKATRDILSKGDFSSIPQLPVELSSSLSSSSSSSSSWLYLSDMASALHVEKLKQLQITHVLTTNGIPNYHKEKMRQTYQSLGIQHCCVSGQDEEGYDMLGKHWKECREFLKTVKNTQNGKVIVHCAVGRNRSGLIAASALLTLSDQKSDEHQVEGMDSLTLLDVVRLISKKRGMVLMNQSFQKQLCILAQREGKLGPKPEGYNDEPIMDEPIPNKPAKSALDKLSF